jgi:beta-fructofuranosidase
MDQVAAANRYIQEHRVPDEDRPVFHVTAPVGWINDPNGFSLYQGKYHLFYQHNPYSDQWDRIHWGHCVSDDFISWKEMPEALAPDSPLDEGGCFSGGALETEDGRHALIYTGFTRKEVTSWEEVQPVDRPSVHEADGRRQMFIQNQCLALGDGIQYQKISANPVIDGDALPAGFSRTDFRDPKVFREGSVYHMLAASRAADGLGQILHFTSHNLRSWEGGDVLMHNDGARLGRMWECPDTAVVDGKRIYMISGQEMQASGQEFFPGSHVFYCFEEDLKKTDDTPAHIEHAANMDYGFDFYATQTLTAADGRIITLAWMQSWDANFKPAGQKWNGQISLPRELHVRDGLLYQSPVRELQNYYIGEGVKYEKVPVSSGHAVSLPRVQGRVLDMELAVQAAECHAFRVRFAHSSRMDLDINVIYNADQQTLTFDRTHIGSRHDIPAVRTIQLKKTAAYQGKDSVLKLRFVLDKCSAEIFINDGAQVFSMTFYTPLEAEDILFEAEGNAVMDVSLHQIGKGNHTAL